MALDWQPVGPWREVIAAGATLAFLGIAEGRAHFVLDATGADQSADPATENIDVRTLAPLIAGAEAAILAEARSVVDWHARHRFCAQCGTPSEVVAGGWTRHCPSCKAHHFPRVDPVVIMLAVKGERALLGRGRRRPGARFSCLAGFMEPGETLEDAVRREVREESGIRCGRVRYLASQPWPFPSTLMMGFLDRGADRGNHGRSRGIGRGALVQPGRNPRHGRTRRGRGSRPGDDGAVVARAGGDRPPDLPPLGQRRR